MDANTLDALEAALAASPDNRLLRRQVMRAALELGRDTSARDHALSLLQSGETDLSIKVILAESYRRLGKTGAGLLITEELFARHDRHLVRVDELTLRETHLRLLLGERRLEDAAQAYLGFQLVDPDWAIPDIEEEVRLPAREAPDRLADAGEGEEDFFFEQPGLTFADVGGMEEVKAEIRMKIIAPLTNPALFAAYGKRAGGGILLYGPPGCGKTYLARATAGEVNARFIAVDLDDILSMWLGESERNLAVRFSAARRHRPAVIFVDEIDALAAKRRESYAGRGGANTVNTFLHELDGIDDDNEGVLVLGATNLPWHVDAAFLRPGRFDRVVFVPPPDRPAREAILALHLRDKPTDGPLDLARVAAKTADFSGADLAAVVDRAAESKLTEALRTGQIEPLRTTDLLAAAKRTRPTVREWLDTARNYVLHANASGFYDDVKAYLNL